MTELGCYGMANLEFEACKMPYESVRVLDCMVCDVCFGALEKMSLEDPLTGLPNRRALQRKYDEAKEIGVIIAAATADIKNFKYVNEWLGHDVGDKFLQRIAEILRKSTRDEVFTARQGGDEFSMLIEFRDKDRQPVITLNGDEVLQTITDRITSNFNEDEVFQVYNRLVPEDKQLGIRIGYSLPDSELGLVDLISEADTKGPEHAEEYATKNHAYAEIIRDLLTEVPVVVGN
jgi:GGDEF domain-containing protein